jgi:hypothetical protein
MAAHSTLARSRGCAASGIPARNGSPGNTAYHSKDAEYFLTEARIAQLAEAKKKQAIVLDHSQANECELGTVGAVARDRSGNLAAATSTGGLVNQQWGRVGAAEVQSNSVSSRGDVRKFVAHDPGLQIRGLITIPRPRTHGYALPASNSAATS